MGKKKVLHYDSAVGDKARTPFAMRLQDLTEDSKAVSALAKYLGCTPQAVNQYRLGTSFPKTENLLKMADFFNVRLEYLLGRSNISSRSESVEAICEYTGLSENAVEKLHKLNPNDSISKAMINVLSDLIESEEMFNLLTTIYSLGNQSLYMQELCDMVDDGSFPEGDQYDGTTKTGAFDDAYNRMRLMRFQANEEFDMVLDEVCSYHETNKRCIKCSDKLREEDKENGKR